VFFFFGFCWGLLWWGAVIFVKGVVSWFCCFFLQPPGFRGCFVVMHGREPHCFSNREPADTTLPRVSIFTEKNQPRVCLRSAPHKQTTKRDTNNHHPRPGVVCCFFGGFCWMCGWGWGGGLGFCCCGVCVFFFLWGRWWELCYFLMLWIDGSSRLLCDVVVWSACVD